MPGNFLQRFGEMIGSHLPGHAAAAAEPAPAPAPEAVAEPAPAPEPVSEPVAAAAEAPSADASSVAATPVESAPVAEAPAAPAAPAKSPEEIEEERLWSETDSAWASGNFERVTELLDALKALEPEDAAQIDEKIAAAQYNAAAQVEQAGDLNRALYLYQEAQRRNPNLGEAGFAIERVQAALQPAPAPEPALADQAPAAPAERTYTVESGDTLSAIAERFYGNASDYNRIFEANRDQLDNPDLIQPGQTLRIP